MSAYTFPENHHREQGRDPVTPTRTILYVGTYERDYPRNQQIIRLLRLRGCEVTEVHRPVWERFRDKSRGAGGWRAGVRLAVSLAAAYVSLWFGLLSRMRGADAVVIGYIGQLDMLLLGTFVRMERKPLIFNPLVTLTDTLVEDRGLVDSQSIGGRVLWLLDWLALWLATAVIVDTPETGEYLANRFGVPERRLCQIDVGADERVFRVPEETPAVNSGDDALLVLFYGKMIPLHGVETILEAIRGLASEPGISFEIIGSGQLEENVQNFRSENPHAPITYRPWVAYSRLPQRIASAGCVLGVFGTGEKAGRVVPNKVFQAMAMGAAIITRDSPAIRRVVCNGESALLVPPGDPTALAEAIVRLRDPGLRGRLGRKARTAFERYGSDRALSHRVGDLLDHHVPADEHPGSRDRFD